MSISSRFLVSLFCLMVGGFLTYGSSDEVNVGLPAFSTWTSVPNGSSSLNKWISSESEHATCSTNDGAADAYLVIPYISSSPAKQVKIVVNFAMRDCSIFHNGCKLSLGVYALVSSKLIDKIPSPIKYKYDHIGDARNTTAVYPFKYGSFTAEFNIGTRELPGLYLALRDQGFCGFVYRVDVSYFTCLTNIYGRLVTFPLVSAPNSTTGEVEVPGKCLDNAVQKMPGSNITLHCRWTGEVRTDEECICKPGFQKSARNCDTCSLGYFKASPGNEACIRCGGHTVNVIPSIKCPCEKDNYRKKGREKVYTDDCYALPSPPANLRVNNLSNDSGLVAWNKPLRPGILPDVWYSISCRNSIDICKAVQSTPSGEKLNATRVLLWNLTAFTPYTFAVYSMNSVSETARPSDWSYALLNFRTEAGLPSQVRKITASQNQNHLTLSWYQPSFIRDFKVSYEILCNSSLRIMSTNDSSISIEMHSSRNVSCKVRARNSVGAGPWVETNFYFVFLKRPTSVPTANSTTNAATAKSTATTTKAATGNVAKSTVDTTIESSALKTLTYVLIGVAVVVVAVAAVITRVLILRRKKREPKNSDVTIRWRRGSSVNSYDRLNVKYPTSTSSGKKKANAIYNDGIDCSEDCSEAEEPIYMEIPDDQYEFSMKKLSIIKVLGEGEFGIVYLANAFNISGNSGTSKVAVKMLKESAAEQSRQDFATELKIMRKLKPHPYVIRLLGCCTYEEPQAIILEYLRHGCLLDLLRRSRGYDGSAEYVLHTTTLSPRQLLEFAYMIAEGMNHLTSQNIVHRDLACRNILVGTSQGKFVCKICDLGLAREPGESTGIYQREKKAILPIKWMAYESIFHGVSSFKSDVWSFGVVLYEITTIGDVPYPKHRAKEVPALIERGYRMEKTPHCSEELYSVMSKCWQKEERNRPSFDELRITLQDLLDKEDHLYLNLDKFNDELYVNFGSEEDEDKIDQ